jgi:putative addiction module component (TIGR02574 family)
MLSFMGALYRGGAPSNKPLERPGVNPLLPPLEPASAGRSAPSRSLTPAGKIVERVSTWEEQAMLSNTLASLLKLPAKDRIELAMALWENLSDEERETELVLTPEQEAELDRRLAEHLANPGSAIPWEEVRRRLASGA